MSLIITSSINPFILNPYLSSGVLYKLTITILPLFFTTSKGISAAGVTFNDEPKHNTKSAFLLC